MTRFFLSGQGAVRAALVLPICLLWAGMAQAVTLQFDQYVTGTDLGGGPLATLEVTDLGAGGVQFTMTNINIASGLDPFITQLFLANSGSAATGHTDDAGVAVKDVANGSFNDPRFSGTGEFQLLVTWATSNAQNGAGRLEVGESSTFTILGIDFAALSLFSGSTPMIHVQGLDGGGSTKYAASPVPLPAAAWLLLLGLGVLGAAGRRHRKAA